MKTGPTASKTLQIGDLLRPHWKALTGGLLAVIGGGIADILQPWPLKIVFDGVLQARTQHLSGWLNHIIESITGGDRLIV